MTSRVEEDARWRALFLRIGAGNIGSGRPYTIQRIAKEHVVSKAIAWRWFHVFEGAGLVRMSGHNLALTDAGIIEAEHIGALDFVAIGWHAS